MLDLRYFPRKSINSPIRRSAIRLFDMNSYFQYFFTENNKTCILSITLQLLMDIGLEILKSGLVLRDHDLEVGSEDKRRAELPKIRGNTTKQYGTRLETRRNPLSFHDTPYHPGEGLKSVLSRRHEPLPQDVPPTCGFHSYNNSRHIDNRSNLLY